MKTTKLIFKKNGKDITNTHVKELKRLCKKYKTFHKTKTGMFYWLPYDGSIEVYAESHDGMQMQGVRLQNETWEYFFNKLITGGQNE